MKKSAHVSSLEANVPFSISGEPDFINNVMTHPFWDAYVIGNVSSDSEIADTPRVVSVIESPRLIFDTDARSIDCNQDYSASAIKYIAHFLEQERQQVGMYTVHGNVISLGNKAIACVGGVSGIGKTTLSARAGQNDWEWTSDEKFVLNESGQYIRGLSTIQADEKSALAANDSRPISPKEPRDIKAFVIPIVARQPLEMHRYDTVKAEYHIYEEMGRNITAGRALLRGYETPLPSLDRDTIARRRYACARELAQRVPMFFMIGEPDAILLQCEKLLSTEE